jgi:hypothetical protein
MPKLSVARLDEVYRKADTTDDRLFAEMRSNVLLVAGEHYTKKGAKFWHRIRTSKELDEQTKLKLTKNHIENICNKIEANIMLFAPDSLCTPNNKDEIQDQKSSELNNSVWQYHKTKLKFRSRLRDFCSSMVQLGECHAKLFWNDQKGKLIGYRPAMLEEPDPLTGNEYRLDEHGNMQTDKNKPVFSGEFELEEVLAFNLLRDPHCQQLDASPYYIVRKMVSKKFATDILRDQGRFAEIQKIDQTEETFLVFDGDRAAYSKEDGQMVMVREHYYRPCMEYPKGYYYITTRDVILTEGELPFGIWPFVSAGYNKIKTTPRFRSPIKTMRPYQIEINRTASEIATTQVTLGQDKVILNHGSKISHGGRVAGVRALTVTGGSDYKVVQGRDGSQFFPHMSSQITELYDVMNVDERDPVKDGQLDPYAMLFISNKNREKFKKQGEAFEEFVLGITELLLEMGKEYLDEQSLIPMIGKSEMVNIEEFKNSEPFRYRVKVEPISDDANTMLGKQLSVNHIMQYMGKELSEVDKGMLIRNMPMLNDEEMGADLTLDYDNCKNDFLAMERGEQPLMNPNDNHLYLINKATNRMRKPDFRFLPIEVQEMYAMYLQEHQVMEQENVLAKQRLMDGFIPTDGPLVTVDYYVKTVDSEGKPSSKRAKFPQRSLEWLEQQIKAQGVTMEQLEEMNQGALAEIASNIAPQGPMPQEQF